MIFVGTVLLASVLPAQESPPSSAPREPSFLKLDHAIPLPGVKGRIDHMALDAKRGLLYVAARGNDTVEVVDLAAKKRRPSGLAGAKEPQGVEYLDAFDALVVANGGNGQLDVFDGDTQKKLTSVPVGDNADNVRYDPLRKLVYVAYGQGALAIVDPLSWKTVGKIELPAQPEAFELDNRTERVFVNVPGEGGIAVVDRATRAAVATWPIAGARKNYPMEFVPEAGRLLIGCRAPAKLLVVDVESGKETAALELSGDVDDIFWDEDRQRAYVSCGEGFVDVFQHTGRGDFKRAGKVATRGGARTCLFVPQLDRLFVAVPEQDANPAELRVLEVVP